MSLCVGCFAPSEKFVKVGPGLLGWEGERGPAPSIEGRERGGGGGRSPEGLSNDAPPRSSPLRPQSPARPISLALPPRHQHVMLFSPQRILFMRRLSLTATSPEPSTYCLRAGTLVHLRSVSWLLSVPVSGCCGHRGRAGDGGPDWLVGSVRQETWPGRSGGPGGGAQ